MTTPTDEDVNDKLASLINMSLSIGREQGWQCALEAVANELAELGVSDDDSFAIRHMHQVFTRIIAKLKEQGFTPDDE